MLYVGLITTLFNAVVLKVLQEIKTWNAFEVGDILTLRVNIKYVVNGYY